MIAFRLLLVLLFPPLAVIDKGCGTFLIVSVLTLAGWVPGMLAAFLIVLADAMRTDGAMPQRTVTIPGRVSRTVVIPDLDSEPLKRGPLYLEGPDGKPLQIIDAPDSDDDDDDFDFPAKRKRLSSDN